MAFSFFQLQNHSQQPVSRGYTKPLYEKYRPETLKDVIGQDHIVQSLRKCLESGDMPHLLFYGPTGTGKSSTIKALCNELYGAKIKDFVLQLNASDERGISIVRDRIKTFAQYGSVIKKDAVPFKIVILDEADSMTDDAQTALRRTMETYSRTTRFCLICNNLSQINSPLRSRCAIFRFKPVSGIDITARIKTIVDAENLKFAKPEEMVQLVADTNGGDFRKILSHLEALKLFYGNVSDASSVSDASNASNVSDATASGSDNATASRVVTEEMIIDTCRAVPGDRIRALHYETTDFDDMMEKIERIIADGYGGLQMLRQLFREILHDESDRYTELDKCAIFQKISEMELRLLQGADEYIQLVDLFSFILFTRS